MAEPTPLKEGKTTAEVLRSSLRRLVLATAVLYVVLFGVGLKVYLDGKSTTESLCAFRADLTGRILQSTQFLKDHPNGTLGIPAKTILDGISNQQRTVLALKDLNCHGLDSEIVAPTPTSTPKPPSP